MGRLDLDMIFGTEVLTNDFNVGVYVVYHLVTEGGSYHAVSLYHLHKLDESGKLQKIVTVVDRDLLPLFTTVLPSQAFAIMDGWDIETGRLKVALHPVSLEVIYQD